MLSREKLPMGIFFDRTHFREKEMACELLLQCHILHKKNIRPVYEIE